MTNKYFPGSRQAPESELEREGKRQVGSIYHLFYRQ